MTKQQPDFSIEDKYPNQIIAGIDEVGRGPWAGPVVAAAVILDRSRIPERLNDSKKLTAKKREQLYEFISKTAITSIGISSVEEIDNINILNATKLAMVRAYEGLQTKVDVTLIDGNQPPVLPCLTESVIKGDSKSLSIAAASVIAKVYRDSLMAKLAQDFSHYGWESNAGYGTKVHIEGLEKYGITIHHRKSFAPIKKILESA